MSDDLRAAMGELLEPGCLQAHWPGARPGPPGASAAGEDVIAPALLVVCAFQAPGPGSKLPNAALGADGRTYVSWVEQTGDRASLHFSAFDDSGVSHSPRQVASGANWFVNWADFPSVSATSDGTVIAHWLEKLGEDTYAYGIRIVISNDAGDSWSDPVWLHDDLSPVEHGFASIVPLGRNLFGAVWLDGRGTVGHDQGATALYYRTIAVTGELGEEVVLDPRVCDCCSTSLVRSPDEALFVAYRDRSEEEVRDISLVRFTPRGRPPYAPGNGEWSAPIRVHADGWEIPGCPVNGPRVTVAKRPGYASEEVAVAWYTGAGGGAGRVLVAFLEEDGFGEPIQVDDGAPIGRVDVVHVGRERLVVAWLEHTGAGAQWRLRFVNADGSMHDSVRIEDVDSGRSSGHLRMVGREGAAFMALTGEGGVRTLLYGNPR